MRWFSVLTISVLLLMPVAHAEEVTGELSLREALELAYERNPHMMAMRHAVEAAEGHRRQAGAYPNPELSVSSSEISEGLRGGSTVGEDSIALSQEVDLLGKARLRRRVAQAELEAAQHTLQQAWSNLVFQVTETYNDVLISTQQVSVSQEVLDLTRRLLDQVQLRYHAGEAMRNELLQTQIEVAKAENALLEAQKAARFDQVALNVLLGRTPQAPLVASDELAHEVYELDAEALMEQAVTQRRDVQAQLAAITAHAEAVRLAKRDTFENPTISLIGAKEDREEVLGVAVSVPLPFWNRNQGAVQEAQAQLAQEHEAHRALQLEVTQAVLAAIEEVRLAQRQVSVWRTAVDQANELIRLATLQYDEGDISFLLYLQHLTTSRETKVTYIETLARYRVQLAALHRAVAANVQIAPSLEVLP